MLYEGPIIHNPSYKFQFSIHTSEVSTQLLDASDWTGKLTMIESTLSPVLLQ